MKMIVYDTADGSIRRCIEGNVNPDAVVTRSGQAVLTNDQQSFPSDWKRPGKMVDTSTDPPSVDDDTGYTEPRTRSKIRQDLVDGTITERKALLELLDS